MTGRPTPKVSVILSAYNEEKYLTRSVQSILDQTFRDLEVILIDDGSTDSTWEIIKGFQDSRVRPVKLDRSGLMKAVNRGLSMARGEYIARMDADDESLPDRIQKQVEFLDSHPDIAVVGTAYFKHDAMRNERYVRFEPTDDAEIRRSMALYIPICQGSVMVRGCVFEKIGGYDEDIPDAEDLDLWLRAAPYFRFANIPEPLYIYWFDPEHSYFESSLGRLRRTMNKIRLSSRAIRLFELPRYYYLLAGGTLVYNLLPTTLKRLARRLVSNSVEEPL